MDTTRDVEARATVLLVDDEELLRRLLSRMLADAGFGVIQAENGAVALDAARTLDGGLGLVVTDVQMPVMNGLEFARAFRPLHPTVPILFMTGRDLPPLPPIEVSDQGVLRKPFRSEVFIERVVGLIGGR